MMLVIASMVVTGMSLNIEARAEIQDDVKTIKLCGNLLGNMNNKVETQTANGVQCKESDFIGRLFIRYRIMKDPASDECIVGLTIMIDA